ncbi:hypothetical protein [Pedobacter foliorum]|uniref:hypothetical protein n=1 Tax=Pedobacter foliorum TaxID=2739058 RepID=UPI0015642432|nr:hypothetical protein [Pedobacter foliorum]NRF38059.1 hypothetical protein [Pedobacter foliorum]
MKTLFTFLLLVFITRVHAQDKLNLFHIVDSETKLPISSVSVSIIRARLAINTENDGVFSIPGNLSAMRDTIIFAAQNYRVYKFPIRELEGRDSIQLVRIAFLAPPKQSVSKLDTLLNDFDSNDVEHYAGVSERATSFEWLQLAQRFDAPKIGGVLKNVSIYRLLFSYTGTEYTKFRVRIYGLDSLTRGPGRDLCSKVIEAKSNGRRRIKIDLTDLNIIIPDPEFFVAVEWVRDFHNMGYVRLNNADGLTTNQVINYRPAIGISPVKTNNLNIWGMNFRRAWLPYSYFSPDFTDLAIKAEVSK